MNIINISEEYMLASYYLSNLRDCKLQRDNLHFRENINRLSQILTWQFSKILEYGRDTINTPFADCNRFFPSSSINMIAIVRAGIPILQVASSMIPINNMLFCTCEKDAKGIRKAILSDEINCENEILVIAEPLMTSASSLLCCVKEVLKTGKPSFIAILNLISTPQAIDNIMDFENETAIKTFLFTCGIDEFTPGVRGTIPGLGDVGDLLYGLKK